MRTTIIPAALALLVLICTGCGSKNVVLPGSTAPIYSVSCDNNINVCYEGAQTLCNGPYELESAPAAGVAAKKITPGSFGWVETDGSENELGGGDGGRYSIRIRCK